MPRIFLLALAVLGLATALPFLTAQRASEDLLALWLAAMSLAGGAPDLVYASTSPVFTMQPPSDAWLDMAASLGHEGQVYPYLYPPIWAALVAPLTGILPFQILELAASIVNPLLLLACGWLGWRVTRSTLPMVGFVLLSQILLYGTTVGSIAILQNQPQILVACLTLLTIERCRADAQVGAGAALALAAAIKLYPALFAPVLLARGQYRAFASFLLVGGGLGLASVAIVGWPLHAAFLETVSSVSATAMRLPATFGFDTVIAGLLPQAAMQEAHAATLSGGTPIGWLVTEKPPLWIWAGRLALIAVLALACLRARSLPEVAFYNILWPALLIATALLSPLAWCYYFIAALSLAPSLLDRLGPRNGALLLLAIALPISVQLLQFRAAIPLVTPGTLSLLGCVSMCALLAAFLFAPPQNGRTTLPE